MYGFDENTVYLSPAPIYHAAPLRFASVVQALGGTVILLERFDAEAALGVIEEFEVTHSQWVPTMFVRMLKLAPDVRERYDLSSMQVVIHAAAPCPVDVKHAMIDWWGPILHEFYTSTESNGATFIDTEQWLRKPGSVGKAGVGAIHICDDSGAELSTDESGIVYFERDDHSFEYHNDAEKTAKSRHPAHPTWSTTGDVGYLDSDGYLFLTDRKAFMIISGGVNIYPQEIENALTLHPKVADVAVIGIPDDEMGESVLAVVQCAENIDPTDELAEELRTFSVRFVSELPRTPTGKMAKGNLRKRVLS